VHDRKFPEAIGLTAEVHSDLLRKANLKHLAKPIQASEKSAIQSGEVNWQISPFAFSNPPPDSITDKRGLRFLLVL
jgi:hypothetical protein